jgi:hypothetical protein
MEGGNDAKRKWGRNRGKRFGKRMTTLLDYNLKHKNITIDDPYCSKYVIEQTKKYV